MTDRTFWVLERGDSYVTVNDEPAGDGRFARCVGWTGDIKEARRWPTQHLADVARRNLEHPFWMSRSVEHAWIDADAALAHLPPPSAHPLSDEALKAAVAFVRQFAKHNPIFAKGADKVDIMEARKIVAALDQPAHPLSDENDRSEG